MLRVRIPERSVRIANILKAPLTVIRRDRSVYPLADQYVVDIARLTGQIRLAQ